MSEPTAKTPIATVGNVLVSVWEQDGVRLVVLESEWEGFYSREAFSPNDAVRLIQVLGEAVVIARQR